MSKTIDLERYKESYLQFVQQRRTVVLSMLDEQGQPFVSYAPVVMKDGKLYIYISQIADHYAYVDGSKQLDVMFLADESGSNNKFAMERARFTCTARNLGNEGYEEIFALFGEMHGAKLIELLRGLDFSLFELTPAQGRYVYGFGLAFDLNIDASEFSHVVVDKSKETVEQGG